MAGRSTWLVVFASVLALVASFVGAAPAKADFNVYTTPGEHTVNGRQWRTWCEPYSQTVRCRTELMATTVLSSGGTYYVANWWTFNNLTYVSSPEELWAGNPLGTPGDYLIDGRRWRTECKTPATGYGCRSYAVVDQMVAVPGATGYTFEKQRSWVFNGIVQFGNLRTDLGSMVTWRPAPSSPPPPPVPTRPAPPTGTYDVKRGPNWTNKVTLTYDDCPTSLAAFRQTVTGARDLGIALALFPTGNCISSGKFDPAFARSNGHYVFNHSVSHPDLRNLSRQGVMNQLSAPGVVTSYGRPPFGAINSTVTSAYAAKGMRIWLWNIDTNDWQNKSQSQVVNYVIRNTRAGDSVLMHMQWSAFNTSALRQMRDGLAARGISVCQNRNATVPVAPAAMDC